MKPARFILNSDYCTKRYTASGKITIQIPNDFTVSGQRERVIVQGSSVVGDPSDCYECYYKTPSYEYTTTGPKCTILPQNASGGDGLNSIALTAMLEKTGNNYTLKIHSGIIKDSGTYYFHNFAMELTVYIYTFKSPFSE